MWPAYSETPPFFLAVCLLIFHSWTWMQHLLRTFSELLTERNTFHHTDTNLSATSYLQQNTSPLQRSISCWCFGRQRRLNVLLYVTHCYSMYNNRESTWKAKFWYCSVIIEERIQILLFGINILTFHSIFNIFIWLEVVLKRQVPKYLAQY